MKNLIKKMLAKIVDIVAQYDLTADDEATIAACVDMICEYLEVMDEG